MTFTPYTLVTMIFSSAAVIVLLNVYLKKVNYEIFFSPTALALILLTPLLRMFIPVEFPFTKVVRSYELLPMVSRAMRQPLIRFTANYGINSFHVLLIIWLAGFAWKEGRGVLRNRGFFECFDIMSSMDDERDRRIISEYFRAKKLKPRKVRLIRLKNVQSPNFFGVREPTVVLPDIAFTDEQLKDVLWHELSHCTHSDMIMARVLRLLCSAYWWLPPVKTFRAWIDDIMEMRADRDVLKGRSREEREKYVDLLNYIDDSYDHNSSDVFNLSNFMSLGFASRNTGADERRYRAIKTPQSPRRQKWLTSLFLVIMVAVMALSFCFVIQPATTGEILYHDNDEASYLIPESGNYLILRDDGDYDLYLNNEYIAKVKNNENFKDFPIYR